MDPLQWMGAVRIRVQTADKNITVIHTFCKMYIATYTEIKNVYYKQSLFQGISMSWMTKKGKNILS